MRVINGNATLLRNCATNPTMYYDVDQASELNSVFSAIAQKILPTCASRSDHRKKCCPRSVWTHCSGPCGCTVST